MAFQTLIPITIELVEEAIEVVLVRVATTVIVATKTTVSSIVDTSSSSFYLGERTIFDFGKTHKGYPHKDGFRRAKEDDNPEGKNNKSGNYENVYPDGKVR
ncbi:hypothetical protein Glove_166g218 [Diversispora epigaea]|uniref:Uncharacterized protein n=1 Tax=Diversispora epigaea TaxID=1348612 RepID=A0A397IZU7_9GLOM|nr:hypothetical protein Glove_166g218 [Diversispora epigaea]